MVKSLPEVWETRVQSLDQEDPLEKEMATHSSYSCLENSLDGGAWSAIVHGVTKSWTWLSNFSLFLFFLKERHLDKTLRNWRDFNRERWRREEFSVNKTVRIKAWNWESSPWVHLLWNVEVHRSLELEESLERWFLGSLWRTGWNSGEFFLCLLI